MKPANWYGPLPGCCEQASEVDKYGKGPFIRLYQTLKKQPHYIVDHQNDCIFEFVSDDPGNLEQRIVFSPIPKDFQFPDEELGEPYWTVREMEKAISYCPFCGAKLPEVELDHNPSGKIYTLLDDGDYCGTCKERSMECNCRPPAAHYRIKASLEPP